MSIYSCYGMINALSKTLGNKSDYISFNNVFYIMFCIKNPFTIDFLAFI